ncbi:hypothetical protein SK069_17330 [Patulibacter brassicae]|jgi:hypothetical protein|uniref:Tripartite tricarboxylate transporter TctB family protein n=1 Tax=Patulibacter brassicae TaxID=1705717 RepID=A0ABU4VQI9_9ACTN|nr:hypothetical protein [Patulibacter brassicae]MDX8153364.1 hypothetical protein [Patulibacter brassicae]
MSHIVLYKAGGTSGVLLAQATTTTTDDSGGGAAPRTKTSGGSGKNEKTTGTSGAGSYQPGGGFPSLKVSPDVRALPGLSKANDGVDGLAAAALIVLLATGVVGVLTVAASNFVQLPRWAEQGKIGIIIAPVGAFVLALLGQLIGWGWSLGVG